ncbi:hypothetical protein CIB84_012723 [Bambusicola thoracicus]|uniref:Cytosolic arginine sensor for mTORC1 subunit 1 n=1 Tax=Bambusicola thoracicus TaxID=9083 RepID=A0A2P4SHE0_BAMTH|nr:hypothetical protein CIB84_012723 [Bambusicola thoracicus]
MELHILEHRVRVLSLARRGLWLYTHPLLKLLFLPQRCRCKFFSLTETPEDYTIMLDEEGFKELPPSEFMQVADSTWLVLSVVSNGCVPSGCQATGVTKIARSVIAPLAEHHVSVLMLSTYQTDFVLVSSVGTAPCGPGAVWEVWGPHWALGTATVTPRRCQVRERDLPVVIHTLAGEFDIYREENGESIPVPCDDASNGFLKPKSGEWHRDVPEATSSPGGTVRKGRSVADIPALRGPLRFWHPAVPQGTLLAPVATWWHCGAVPKGTGDSWWLCPAAPSPTLHPVQSPQNRFCILTVAPDTLPAIATMLIDVLFYSHSPPKEPGAGDLDSITFFSFSLIEGYISIVMDAETQKQFPSDLLLTSSSGELWRMVRIGGQPLGFDECGIVAQIAEPLAAVDISAYYISTFNFDHALVPEEGITEVIELLQKRQEGDR